jgi:hypothetical protein
LRRLAGVLVRALNDRAHTDDVCVLSVRIG